MLFIDVYINTCTSIRGTRAIHGQVMRDALASDA
jgi:hypothetical protein